MSATPNDRILTEGFPEGWSVQDRIGENTALLLMPHWQFGSSCVCLRPKAITTDAWLPTARKIAAGMAAPASAAEPEDQELATRPIAVEICDAVLEWIVKHDFGDRDDEFSVAEVIAILDHLYEEEASYPADPKTAEEVLRRLVDEKNLAIDT